MMHHLNLLRDHLLRGRCIESVLKLLNLDVFVFALPLVLLGEHMLLADFDLESLLFLILTHYNISALGHIVLGHVNVVLGLHCQAGLFIRDLGKGASQ